MTYQPNAQQAKKIADDAVYAAKQVATDAFLGTTLTTIADSAKAGFYSVTVDIDGTLNLPYIRNVLEARLGYTTIPATDGLTLFIEWQSAARDQVSVPNSLDKNPKFNAN